MGASVDGVLGGEGACALTVRIVSLPRDVSQVLNSSNSRSI